MENDFYEESESSLYVGENNYEADIDILNWHVSSYSNDQKIRLPARIYYKTLVIRIFAYPSVFSVR